VTNEERDRRLSVAEMDCIELGVAYRHLSDAIRLFGTRIRGTRPDECEAFFQRWRAQKARADAEFERIEAEVFEANVGITNDGPDRWGPI
jgi:hypothetical protein